MHGYDSSMIKHAFVLCVIIFGT